MAESASAKIQQEAKASSSVNIDIPEERPCIYKVPDPLRKFNEEVYSPRVISIGPFHHGDEKLQNMENYKVTYLKEFVKRENIDMEDLKQVVKDLEESVRQCYADLSYSDDFDFVTMIVTDAMFIIEFFLRNKFNQLWSSEDQIVLKPWFADRIKLDLILLENQLPFFIIVKLFDLAFASRSRFPSFVVLTFEYFHSYNKQNMHPNPQLKILHFLDLLRDFFLPPHDRLPTRKPETVELMHSATELDGVGLKFEEDLSRNCLLDLDLHLGYIKGVLKIPCFTFDDDTKLHVRNLLALEQCHYPNLTYVTDHFILLDSLINSEKDLDLLRRQGIVVNRSSKKHETYFIRDLCTGITHPTMSPKYYDICINLKKFYEKPNCAECIRRNYFSSTLWQAASIVTILTLIQTGCSLFSVIKHP